MSIIILFRGCISDVRALPWHGRGGGFEPLQLHQIESIGLIPKETMVSSLFLYLDQDISIWIHVMRNTLGCSRCIRQNPTLPQKK